MKYHKTVSVFLFVIILLAACGSPAPAAPSDTASYSVAVLPSASPSVSPAIAAAPLYSGPYDDSILPASIPDIGEADKKAFNPNIVPDYLATSDSARHDYFIKGAELKGNTLYLTIKDNMSFHSPADAYQYLKEKFSLSDNTILGLPEFSGCYFSDESLETHDGSLDLKSRMLAPVPVPEDVNVYPNSDEINFGEFTDFLLNGKNKNEELSVHAEFICSSEGQITRIYYSDAEAYGTPIDRENLTSDVIEPQACGYGSLPKQLLGVNDVSAEIFDPGKVTEYLLASPLHFEDHYDIRGMQISNGHLSLNITDSISIDADEAYQYLKSKFPQSDKIIEKLPLFSGCSLHGGTMWTQDAWDHENGIEAESEDDNLNGIGLAEIDLPSEVPLADDAQIILVDNADTCRGYYLNVQQFTGYLQNMKAEEGSISISGVWFIYSNGEIKALIEEYVP